MDIFVHILSSSNRLHSSGFLVIFIIAPNLHTVNRFLAIAYCNMEVVAPCTASFLLKYRNAILS